LSHAFLPELTHLELWLGTENYGATSTAEDCVPLLSAELFPKLRYLGLRDSEIQDDIAIVVAKSPFLCQLETLDLSMGTLSDFGAEVLLESLFIPKLKKLDLHHHYCSNEMMALLRRLPCEVDLGEQQKIDPRWRNHRFVAVSE